MILLLEIRLQVTACAGHRNAVIVGKLILTGLKPAAGKAEGVSVVGCVLPSATSKAGELYRPSCPDTSHL